MSERDLFWGEPEVFWVAIQAICAVAGLIVLVAYTYYARQQARDTQATLRASLTPFIAVTGQHHEHVQKGTLEFEGYFVSYRNVGQGAALRLRAWHRHADKLLVSEFDTKKIIRYTHTAVTGTLDSEDLPRDGLVKAYFNEYTEGYKRLYVLEAEDQAGGFHQVLLLVGLPGGPRVHNISVLKDHSRP